MIYPHVIRLRHPWSSDTDEGGQTIHRRKFNRPTGLSEREQVWLVLDLSSLPAGVSVNGVALDVDAGVGDGRLAWEVTGRLADHNEVAIAAVSEVQASAIEEGVSIEIRLGPVGDF